jgi:hypothetical protein
VVVWRRKCFFVFVQEIVKVHATRNLSQGGFCYMLIQILQSKGQILTSGARPVARGLGRVEWNLKLALSMPNRDACGGGAGGCRPRGMDHYRRLYIFLVSHCLGLIASLGLPMAFVNTPDIVKFCWLAPVVFTSLCWREFSTLKSYIPRCVFFSIFVICLSLL